MAAIAAVSEANKAALVGTTTGAVAFRARSPLCIPVCQATAMR